MPQKRRNKKARKGSSGVFVVDRLVNNESRIPVQPLYSDTPYWYDLKKLELAWANPSNGFPRDFYSAVKGSPEVFANALPASYRDRINEVWVQEFEFSPSAIAFNSYQKSYIGNSFYRRDIITGTFSYKSGRLSGVATSALRGWLYSDGSTAFEHYVRCAFWCSNKCSPASCKSWGWRYALG